MNPVRHRNIAGSARGMLALALLIPVACAGDAVQWRDETRAASLGTPSTSWLPPSSPQAAAACQESLVAARARGDTAFAAWWSPQSDGSARLVVARSDDGGRTWRDGVVADSTDRGRSGCLRPTPFLATDSSNGYVHLVYFLVAREGPGVFFTHSMEGGEMFHEPVPIVYGERPSAAAVASRGDTVLVAYQDPNASAPQVWLALSRSTGHIFEQRVGVSSANVVAANPGITIAGRDVVVWWDETARGGGSATRVTRRGTLRR